MAHLFKPQDEALWRLRLGYNAQLLFSCLKTMSEEYQCARFAATMKRGWFSGYDINRHRLLPDGSVIAGGVSETDLKLRDAIVEQVLDDLKTKPRGGDKPRSAYQLDLKQYELVLTVCQTYEQTMNFLRADSLDAHDCSTLETVSYTLMQVVGAHDYNDLVKEVDDDELEALAM